MWWLLGASPIGGFTRTNPTSQPFRGWNQPPSQGVLPYFTMFYQCSLYWRGGKWHRKRLLTSFWKAKKGTSIWADINIPTSAHATDIPSFWIISICVYCIVNPCVWFICSGRKPSMMRLPQSVPLATYLLRQRVGWCPGPYLVDVQVTWSVNHSKYIHNCLSNNNNNDGSHSA